MLTASTTACRVKPRITASFPVRVRGVDADGEPFVVDAVLDNLSTGGLHVRLPRRMRVDDQVFAIVYFSCARNLTTPAPGVAVRGVVLRSEPQPDGSCGVAIGFKHYRLI